MSQAKTIPAFPNHFPFNELLLDGKLRLGKYGVKTRSMPWKHRGLTLLYSSSRVSKATAEAHRYDAKTSPRRVILGVGELIEVRQLTETEFGTMCRQFNNTTAAGFNKLLLSEDRPYVMPFELGYFFRNLQRFETPVEFAWPSGPVRSTNVPVAVVAKELRTLGIRF